MRGGAWGIGTVPDEYEAGEVREGEDELEVAGLRGEGPVGFAEGRDEHGGDRGLCGGTGRGVDDGYAEEGGGEVVEVEERVWEREGDVAGRDCGFKS